MNFKECLLKEDIELTNEYWIEEDGSLSSDELSDTGPSDHAIYVADRVQHEIVEELGYDEFSDEEYVDFESFKKKFIKNEAKKKGVFPSEIDFYKALTENGISSEKIKAAEMHGDARDYAMKNWGWKAIRGHYVDSWTLTPSDMQVIAKGIDNILDQEGYDEELDDEELEFVVSSYQHSPITITLAELRAGRAKRLGIGAAKIQQALSQQATQQVRDIELQKMHPYYREKELERQDRYLGIKKPEGMREPPTTINTLRKLGILKPGEKYGSPTSESLNFKKWIQLQEIEGYHGSEEDFEKFNPKMLGKSKRTTISKLGFFFAPTPKEANIYADLAQRGGGFVSKWELDIKNPYNMPYEEFIELIDWGNLPSQKYDSPAKASKATIAKRKQLDQEGYDGVYIYDRNGQLAEIIVFYPGQAKRIETGPSTDIWKQ